MPDWSTRNIVTCSLRPHTMTSTPLVKRRRADGIFRFTLSYRKQLALREINGVNGRYTHRRHREMAIWPTFIEASRSTDFPPYKQKKHREFDIQNGCRTPQDGLIYRFYFQQIGGLNLWSRPVVDRDIPTCREFWNQLKKTCRNSRINGGIDSRYFHPSHSAEFSLNTTCNPEPIGL